MAVNQFVKKSIALDGDVYVGLAWEEVKDRIIDFDLQCIFMNEIGQLEDAVFYNQLYSKSGNVFLSGDSVGEKQGFDELLTIRLREIPFGIRYLVVLVCSYKGEPFSSAETAQIQILQNSFSVSNISIGSQGNNLSFCPFVFERYYDGNWYLNEPQIQGQGKTFVECEQTIKQALFRSGFDEGLFLECQNWTGGKSFKIEKEDTLLIPKHLNEIFVGLGWDTTCDVDSSLLLFNGQGEMIENIFFGHKHSSDGSILHHGDDLTGAGGGDDELITIKLDKVNPKIKCIWSVITIYTSNSQFDDVKGAFCRLVDPKTKQEYCKFNLSRNQDGVSNGCIMCCLTRNINDNWSISPKGFFTKNTKTSTAVVPIIKELMFGNFSSVKILEDLQSKKTHQILIKKATGLASFDVVGSSDPFVVIKVNKKQMGKTKIIKNNVNPEWNETFKLNLYPHDVVEFVLYDYDTFLSDDFMGTCFLKLDETILNNYNYEDTLKVHDKKFKINPKFTGQLHITLKKVA